jgi:hypothetical protein
LLWGTSGALAAHATSRSVEQGALAGVLAGHHQNVPIQGGGNCAGWLMSRRAAATQSFWCAYARWVPLNKAHRVSWVLNVAAMDTIYGCVRILSQLSWIGSQRCVTQAGMGSACEFPSHMDCASNGFLGFEQQQHSLPGGGQRQVPGVGVWVGLAFACVKGNNQPCTPFLGTAVVFSWGCGLCWLAGAGLQLSCGGSRAGAYRIAQFSALVQHICQPISTRRSSP